MKKQLLTLALALALCAGLTVPAVAVADKDDPTANLNYRTIANSGGYFVVREDGTLWNIRDNYGTPTRVEADDHTWKLDGVKYGWTVWSMPFALKQDGSIWSWNSQIIPGDGTEYAYHSAPVKLMDDVEYFQYADASPCDLQIYCAIKKDGSLWTWGDYTGDGTAERRLTPVKVMDHVAAVYPVGWPSGTSPTGGRLTVFALKDDGSLWGWGDYGTVGDWSSLDAGISGQVCLEPTKLMDDVVSVTTVDYDMDMALCSDGTLWHWGSYCYTVEEPYTFIYTSQEREKIMDHVAAIDRRAIVKQDGSFWRYEIGQDGVFAPVKCGDNVVRAGDDFSLDKHCAFMLKADGSLYLRSGENQWQYALNNVVDACSSYDNALALRSDGTVWLCEPNKAPVKQLDRVRLPSKTTKPEPGSPFADVRSSQYFYEPVKWAVANGITTGTNSTTFSPNNTCTRAQIITFLWRAAGSPSAQGELPFADVAEDKYYAEAVRWAAEQGMADGDSFAPDAPCTRAMAVEFMWKAAGSPSAPAADFADVPATAEYADAVAWALKEGVTSGTSTTTFSPDNTTTRGQIVTFLWRYFT